MKLSRKSFKRNSRLIQRDGRRVLMNGRMWIRDLSKGKLYLGPLVFQGIQLEHKNKQTMLKADNNNDYNYKQVLGEKHT